MATPTVTSNKGDIDKLAGQTDQNTLDINNAKSASKLISELDLATLADNTEFTVQLNGEW